MEKKMTKNREKTSKDISTIGVDIITVVKDIRHKQHNHTHTHTPNMGTGSCTLCDCQGFIPSSGGRTCINLNSAGGTCNHYLEEHN